jgi:hypothetical protein
MRSAEKNLAGMHVSRSISAIQRVSVSLIGGLVMQSSNWPFALQAIGAQLLSIGFSNVIGLAKMTAVGPKAFLHSRAHNASSGFSGLNRLVPQFARTGLPSQSPFASHVYLTILCDVAENCSES